MKQLVSNANELNEIISIYSITNSVDENGVPIKEEKKIFDTFAKVMTHLLKEFKGDAGNYFEDKTTFIIRYDQPAEITATMKIYWGEHKYEVVQLLRDNAEKKFDTVITKIVK